jgi:hypothetical protein
VETFGFPLKTLFQTCNDCRLTTRDHFLFPIRFAMRILLSRNLTNPTQHPYHNLEIQTTHILQVWHVTRLNNFFLGCHFPYYLHASAKPTILNGLSLAIEENNLRFHIAVDQAANKISSIKTLHALPLQPFELELDLLSQITISAF